MSRALAHCKNEKVPMTWAEVESFRQRTRKYRHKEQRWVCSYKGIFLMRLKEHKFRAMLPAWLIWMHCFSGNWLILKLSLITWHLVSFCLSWYVKKQCKSLGLHKTSCLYWSMFTKEAKLIQWIKGDFIRFRGCYLGNPTITITWQKGWKYSLIQSMGMGASTVSIWC